MAHYANMLNNTCWNALVNGVYQPFTFQLSPSFYHSGAIFKLGFFNQCDRWADNIVSEYQADGLLLRAKFGADTYYATYTGANKLEWKSNEKSMTWSLTHCFMGN